MLLVDTNVLVDVLENDPEWADWFAPLDLLIWRDSRNSRHIRSSHAIPATAIQKENEGT